jgi:hypothetical protein
LIDAKITHHADKTTRRDREGEYFMMKCVCFVCIDLEQEIEWTSSRRLDSFVGPDDDSRKKIYEIKIAI